MTAEYGIQRRQQLHVVFRLESRARMAVDAVREFGEPIEADERSVLDLGAAEGATLEIVHRLLDSRDSIGIEYARDLIEAAPPLSSGIRLVQGDVTQPHPEIAPASRDLVLALAVLEHLESPADLFAQACRALRPGGLFVATCPSGSWDALSGFFRLHPEEHHETAFTRRTFETCARGASLEPVAYRRFMNAPLAFLPYLRVPISPSFALQVDSFLRRLRLLDFCFVNQLFVARKPRR